MKIRPQSKSDDASVLVIALVTAAIMGITLGSYMLMARAQNLTVARSQAWNAALAMAEAGVEEALAQLNPGVGTNADRTANGWGSAVGGFHGPVARDFTNASYQVKFSAELFPTIYATGHVTMPLFADILTRVVKVRTTNTPLFSAALVCLDGITMNGNNITTDSFNSNDPNLSNNGRFDPTRTSTNGDIASMYGIVDINNADINGDVLLGPTATNRTIGSNGSVTGDITYDFNVECPDVLLPAVTWFPQSPNARKIDGVDYQYVFENNGNYILTTSPKSVYVGTNAQVKIRVATDASVDLIRVAGQGTQSGKLAIYMSGERFALGGNSVVDGGVARNLNYYGLPTNTRITMGGDARFIGTMYAPSASLAMSGGGSDPIDFIGSLVVRTATLNGHFNFHFDEDLLGPPIWRGYVAISWEEL